MKYEMQDAAAWRDRNRMQETSMSQTGSRGMLKDRRTFLAVGGAAALFPLVGVAFADTRHPNAFAAVN